MPKGHKSGCQCAVCKRIANSNEPTVRPLHQQVVLIKPTRKVPEGTNTTIEGVNIGANGIQYKIIYRANYFWVGEEDIKTR